MVDFDKDGDVDLFTFDDRAMPIPQTAEQGLVHLWKNDGTGNFEFVPNDLASGLTSSGANMGYAFTDFNCDGELDFSVTRVGPMQVSYFIRMRQAPEEVMLGAFANEEKQIGFGSKNGTFIMSSPMDASGQKLFAPCGWGVVAADFDNDGDADVAYSGEQETYTIGQIMNMLVVGSSFFNFL